MVEHDDRSSLSLLCDIDTQSLSISILTLLNHLEAPLSFVKDLFDDLNMIHRVQRRKDKMRLFLCPSSSAVRIFRDRKQ